MVTKLDVAYDKQIVAVRKRVVLYAKRAWASLSAYRDSDFERFVDKVVPRIEAAQKQTAEITDSYISRVVAAELASGVARGSVAPVTTVALRGVAAADIYHRPFSSVYAGLSSGKSLQGSAKLGQDRLLEIVTTNIQLSKTHSAKRAMGRTGRVQMFERVLTGRESCTLCAIASTQRYWVKDLLPIHPGCDCDVRPLIGDPNTQIINRERLEGVHAAVTREFGESDRGARLIDGRSEFSDYTDLIATNDHSEIGPVLSWRHHNFTSRGDLPN